MCRVAAPEVERRKRRAKSVMASGSSSSAAGASGAAGAAGAPTVAVPVAEPGVAPDTGEKAGPAAVDASRWVVIYPAYLDKRKTQAEGRKVGSDIAVISPHAIEIFKICSELGIVAKLELNKTYSRDFFSRGRVRVKLYKDDGANKEPLMPNIESRKSLYRHIALAFADFRARNGSLEKHGDPMSLVSLGVTKTADGKAAGSSAAANKKKGKKR